MLGQNLFRWVGWVVLAAAGLLCVPVVSADFQVRGPEGRLILLKDDGTWEYVEAAGDVPAEHVRLSVERVEPGPRSCTIGLRLVNNLNAPLRSLVPQFSAYTDGQIKIETVFQSFARIKPTQDQYQEIRFAGITCGDISHVLVHGADRCSMGDMTKFSSSKGECLRHVRVIPSKLINITK